MAIIVSKRLKHGKCACCGSSKYYAHRFQFFQYPDNKVSITLCDACVNQMHTIVLKDMCDRIDRIDRLKKECEGGGQCSQAL